MWRNLTADIAEEFDQGHTVTDALDRRAAWERRQRAERKSAWLKTPNGRQYLRRKNAKRRTDVVVRCAQCEARFHPTRSQFKSHREGADWFCGRACQARRVSRARAVRYDALGRCVTLAEWSKLVGVSERTLWLRIWRLAWPLGQAFSTPSQRSKRGEKP